MQKEIEFLESLQRVIFEFLVSLKENGKKYLIKFEGSCEEICISNAYVDFATAGGYRGVITFYFQAQLVSSKQSWARRSKTLTLFTSSVFVTWCMLARSMPIGLRITANWLISRRNNCALRSFIDWHVATNRRSIAFLYKHRIQSFSFLHLGPAETLKILERRTHKKISLSPSFQSFFHKKTQSLFPSVVFKIVYQVYWDLGLPSKYARKKRAKHHKSSQDNFSKRRMIAISRKYDLEAKEGTFWHPEEGHNS